VGQVGQVSLDMSHMSHLSGWSPRPVVKKLKRRTFAATFMLACFAALKLESIRFEDI
jgi:hypothetical protein